MVLLLLVVFPFCVHSTLYSTFASSVFGQSDFFSDSPIQLRGPRGVAFSPDESDLYVVDTQNNRVVMFPQNRVYGQLGSFTTTTINRGGVSANSLRFPSDAAVSRKTGALLVSDTGNHRVLYYPEGSTTATRVYGQPDFVTNTIQLPISANSLNRPTGVAFDDSDNIYIADFENFRVLYYEGANTTASRVYGQNGRFDTNIRGLGNDAFYGPYAVHSFGNRLLISDTGNHRVLFFRDDQLEQIWGGNGVSGVSRTLFNGPYDALLDSIGGVLVSDVGNRRVLYFLPESDEAVIVFGQNGSFTSNTNNLGGTSQTSFSFPSGIAIAQRRGLLALADSGNNRVLLFPIINTINLNQIVIFPDGGLVAPNSTLQVLGNLSVIGDLHVDQSGLIQFNSENPINVANELQIESNTTLVLKEVTQFPVTVMQYRSVINTFEQVIGSDDCPLRQTYTLSALIVTKDNCASNPQISSDEQLDNSSKSVSLIIGVSIACILVGAAAAVSIVIYFRWKQHRFTRVNKERLKKKELDGLKPNPGFGNL